MQIFVDTNVFLRIILNDNQKQADEAKSFLTVALNDGVDLVSSNIVFFEIAWVLKSAYNVAKEDLIEILKYILYEMSFVKFDNRKLLKKSLDTLITTNIELIDCYNLCFAIESKSDDIFTFDQNLKKVFYKYKG